MKFRWTIEELNTKSDVDMLKGLLNERMGDLNPYAPLYKRLASLHKKLDTKEALTTEEAKGEVGYIGFYLKKEKEEKPFCPSCGSTKIKGNQCQNCQLDLWWNKEKQQYEAV
jgi:hypothetical protein